MIDLDRYSAGSIFLAPHNRRRSQLEAAERTMEKTAVKKRTF